MGIFISVPKTVECVVLAALFAAAFAATFLRSAGALQSFGYGNKKLFAWAGKGGNAILLRQSLLTMLCALSYAVISLCFSFLGEWAAVLGCAAFLLFFVLYVIADRRSLRSPATFTPRLKRLYVITFTLTLCLVYLAVTLLNFADYLSKSTVFTLLRYCPLAAFPMLTLPILALANLLAKIYETPKNRSYIKRARAKLSSSGLKVVGITGSYAKTSVKHILSAILSKKYRVLSTPRSHNTPLGLALTINGARLEDYDLFIAEMGARNVGDIAELCALCPPDYSVITGICPQHLESFRTEENIVKAKGEILSATKIKAVIAADCYEKFVGFPAEKVACGCAKDITCSPEGCEFTLTLGGRSARVKSKLLGEHSARNIALAAEVAHLLGVDFDDICGAIENLEYIEHRLQLIKSGGVNILDDGYNSNVMGAAAALSVLRSFGGKKIAVTPGLVELGVLEERENFSLGQKLAGLDLVILVGETLVTPVKEGYLSAGGDKAKLITVPTLAAAQKQLEGRLSAGDTVLFLNDLPDIYL